MTHERNSVEGNFTWATLIDYNDSICLGHPAETHANFGTHARANPIDLIHR